MNIVFLSRSKTGAPHAFVQEQADVLSSLYHINISQFLIKQGGVKGMLKSALSLSRMVRNEAVDIVHVHYGLWTMVAVLARILANKSFKIVVTYHGSDLYKEKERTISLTGARFADWNIPVSLRMSRYFKNRFTVIPCGVDIATSYFDPLQTRAELGWNDESFVVLFCSSFDRPVKDPGFAFSVIDQLRNTCKRPVIFVELKGYNRLQLTRMMQAADAMLMCSNSEGSPQVIKEALLHGLPVVSNPVGDVPDICKDSDHTFIVPKQVHAFSEALNSIAITDCRVEAKDLIACRFDNRRIAQKILEIYKEVLDYASSMSGEFVLDSLNGTAKKDSSFLIKRSF